uniref:Elongator complex protein 6 n=1 Tax=Rhodosorus marinus TaxID=101924 RepID=A0A7S0BCT7_9RHOD|mmetsp:Transcript_10936/g.15767  ORF Transcript_10936/g.15767 Transcript_10936/m.15767 type:complete len:257 (+) Transcript_10936:32-802(+)
MQFFLLEINKISMETELWSVLRWGSEAEISERRRRLVVLDQAGSSGSFLLIWLMRMYVQAGVAVVFISTERHLFHYLSVLRKLGLSLTKTKPLISFIDCLTETEAISPRPSFPEHRLELASCVVKETRVHETHAKGILHELSERLEEAMAEENHPACVIVDNLSTLKQRIGENNLHQLWSLVRRLGISYTGLVHSDVETAGGMNEIIFGADAVISVEPLSTGASMDYDGKCLVTMPTKTTDLLFRVEESRVRFFQK